MARLVKTPDQLQRRFLLIFSIVDRLLKKIKAALFRESRQASIQRTTSRRGGTFEQRQQSASVMTICTNCSSTSLRILAERLHSPWREIIRRSDLARDEAARTLSFGSCRMSNRHIQCPIRRAGRFMGEI